MRDRPLLALAVVTLLATACATTRPASHPTASASGRSTPPSGTSEHGLVSYYADSLAGHAMANGRPYDPARDTCAHRTYPFGTQVRVEVDSTRATATCIVSDRGPFVNGRILDVSKSVARALGLLQTGVARAQVEVVR